LRYYLILDRGSRKPGTLKL